MTIACTLFLRTGSCSIPKCKFRHIISYKVKYMPMCIYEDTCSHNKINMCRCIHHKDTLIAHCNYHMNTCLDNCEKRIKWITYYTKLKQEIEIKKKKRILAKKEKKTKIKLKKQYFILLKIKRNNHLKICNAQTTQRKLFLDKSINHLKIINEYDYKIHMIMWSNVSTDILSLIASYGLCFHCNNHLEVSACGHVNCKCSELTKLERDSIYFHDSCNICRDKRN
jgi:hypothetical protein